MAYVGNGESGLSSASSYVETYMDYVEALPDDMQRDISQMRELDMLYQEKLREIGRLIDKYHRRKESSVRKCCLIQIQRCLAKSQELGDEKLQHVSHMMDMVDTKSRQVDIEMEYAEVRNDPPPAVPFGKQEIQDEETSQKAPEKLKRNRRRLQEKISKEQDVETANMSTVSDTPKPAKKKKLNRKKKNKENNSPTPDVPIDDIDPNEPTYCLCNQVSYGEMIGCDNDGCEIEWFHFQCVNLTSKPKGRWYCPKCSQERKQKKTDKNEKNEKIEKPEK